MIDFATAARDIVDDFLRHEPIYATFQEVHDYDAELPDVSTDGFAGWRSRAKRYLETLSQYAPASLTHDDRVDAELLRSHFEVALREFDELEFFKHDPAMYVDVAVEGIYALLVRDSDSPVERLAAMQSRLEQIPAVLAAGKSNIGHAPAVWLDTASEITRGGIEFFRDAVAPLTTQRPSMTAALEGAFAALDGYLAFVEGRRASSDGAPFAVGRDLFDYKLKREHMLPYDAASLAAFGEQAVRSTQAALDAVAREIDDSKSWPELIEHYREDHPEPAELLGEYRRGMDEVKRFILERQIVTIPSGERLSIVETPVFLRPTLPYAAYQAPGAFAKRQDGLYYVTPVDTNGSFDSRRDQLRGHNRYGMLLTNVHEGYPGHHLQLVNANRHPSVLRRLFGDSSVFAEGWALYCEQMILDEGLTGDPRVRLFQLKDQLWRACRVVVDVALHTGGMSFQAAVDFMVDVAHLERFNAIGEVRRYTRSATQPMSYLVGKHQILDFREREKKRLGATFALRAFHDRLLSFGTIPIALIEAA